MKKCMKCGGNMMSKGGKVTPLKKRKEGGASESKGCPPGYYWTVMGCEKKGPDYKGPFSSTGSKIGIGTTVGGIIGLGVKRISDAVKAKKEKKKENQETVDIIKKANVKRIGGAKYKSGGIAKQKIVAFPGYNARTDTMKMGGFKDLSGDGKITKKDVLIGRGVIKKSVKKK